MTKKWTAARIAKVCEVYPCIYDYLLSLGMARLRAIPKAIDLLSGEVLTATEVFATAKQAAEIRKRYNENQVKPKRLHS